MNGHVGLGFRGERNSLPAVLGLGDHLPARLAAQDRAKPGTDHVVIVSDQDARAAKSCLPALNPYSPKALTVELGRILKPIGENPNLLRLSQRHATRRSPRSVETVQGTASTAPARMR